MSVPTAFHPLHDPKALAKGWKKQLTAWLEDQGAGTVARAARDEEWRDLWAAELTLGKRTFHVALTGTGDGAIWDGDEVAPIGDVVQHHGEVRLDADTVRALEASVAEAGPPVRVRLAPASLRTPVPRPASSGDLPARLDEIEAALQVDPKDRATRRRLGELAEAVFGRGARWAPYPKRPFTDLDEVARRYVRLVAQVGGGPALQYAGLTPPWGLARYVGLAPAGPADLPVPLDGRAVPFWILATHVGSGSVDGAAAHAALADLDPAALLDAWTEVADGRALDALQCWTVVAKEADIPLTRRRLAYQARLFAWMGEVAARLGAPARAAAEGVVQRVEDRVYGWGWRALCGLSALAATGGIPEAHAALLVELSRTEVVGIDAWWPDRLAAWHAALPDATRARVGPLHPPKKPRV